MMLFRQLQGFQSLCQLSMFNYVRTLRKSEKLVQGIPEHQLTNTTIVKQTIESPIKKRTRSSQYQLWHGLRPQSGNQTCFSEKKTRRSWMPNILKQKFYSSILERHIHTKVSAKAFKCIRKLNGFDNYILMTPPKQLDSTYGEYLRRIMLKKVNDPTFEIPRVANSEGIKKQLTKYDLKRKETGLWFPPELRYKDLTHLRVRGSDELSPRELRKQKELENLIGENKDIPANHPLLMDVRSEVDPKQFYDVQAFEKEVQEHKEKFLKSLNANKLKTYNDWEEYCKIVQAEEEEGVTKKQVEKRKAKLQAKKTE